MIRHLLSFFWTASCSGYYPIASHACFFAFCEEFFWKLPAALTRKIHRPGVGHRLMTLGGGQVEAGKFGLNWKKAWSPRMMKSNMPFPISKNSNILRFRIVVNRKLHLPKFSGFWGLQRKQRNGFMLENHISESPGGGNGNWMKTNSAKRKDQIMSKFFKHSKSVWNEPSCPHLHNNCALHLQLKLTKVNSTSFPILPVCDALPHIYWPTK